LALDSYTACEWVAALSGVLGVWLTARQNVWCWPIGLVSVLLSALVFLHSRLYGSTALQIVYAALSVYGWYEWLHGGAGDGRLEVSRTPPRWRAGLTLAALALSVVLGVFLRYRTNAVLPWWDAGTTAFSLAAQLMTTRKWLESWLLWIPLDVVYVGMYLSQGLPAFAGLYAVYLVLAVLGLVAWRRSMVAGERATA
jgi:nicotinamide mononucleotide transporter